MKLLKKIIKDNLILLRFLRAWRLFTVVPIWEKLNLLHSSEWSAAVKSGEGKNVLIATSVGAHLPGLVMESLLAAALIMRKTRVDVLLCDGSLEGCLDCMLGITLSEKEMADWGPKRKLCRLCNWIGKRVYKPMGVKIHSFGELVEETMRREIKKNAQEIPCDQIGTYKYEGLSIGEHALAGALRFYARGVLTNEKYSEAILRKYFEASLMTAYAMKRLVKNKKYDCAVFHHGIYVPQGPIGEVCRAEGIRMVNWNPAYRKKCFIFSHGDTYHHTLMVEPVSSWENLVWNDRIESKLAEYLKSRWTGSHDWIWFHEKPRFEMDQIAKDLNLDYAKPIIGVLTNVFWDAQLHYPANVFPNMLEWLIDTIEHLGKRIDLQVVIRIHPAEVTASIPSRQKLADEIARRFPSLPQNIRIIHPESNISTYVVMEKCDSVIIYGTKTGVELASMGIPVIVAGEAWIRNKGLTEDPRTRDEYFKILDLLPLDKRMAKSKIERARKYAFHFFFRRMIPVEALHPQKGWPPFQVKVNSLESIMPGKDKGLDIICDGILNGEPFIYPAESNL